MLKHHLIESHVIKNNEEIKEHPEIDILAPTSIPELIIVFNHDNEFIMFEYKPTFVNSTCSINVLCPYFHNKVFFDPSRESLNNYLQTNYELFVSSHKQHLLNKLQESTRAQVK